MNEWEEKKLYINFLPFGNNNGSTLIWIYRGHNLYHYVLPYSYLFGESICETGANFITHRSNNHVNTRHKKIYVRFDSIGSPKYPNIIPIERVAGLYRVRAGLWGSDVRACLCTHISLTLLIQWNRKQVAIKILCTSANSMGLSIAENIAISTRVRVLSVLRAVVRWSGGMAANKKPFSMNRSIIFNLNYLIPDGRYWYRRCSDSGRTGARQRYCENAHISST